MSASNQEPQKIEAEERDLNNPSRSPEVTDSPGVTDRDPNSKKKSKDNDDAGSGSESESQKKS